MFHKSLATYLPTIVLMLFCVIFSILSPSFFSVDNFIRIAKAASIPLVLGLGATFVLLVGSIDLSIEGEMGLIVTFLCFLVANALDRGIDISLWAIPVVLAAGVFMGFINGFLHIRLKIPSFISSLCLGFIGIGFATFILKGERVRIFDDNIRALALQRFLNIPLMVWVAAVVFCLTWFIQKHTIFGRHLYALGGDEKLAENSGVKVKKIRLMAFMMAGFFTALGAIMAVAQLGRADAMIGDGRLFYVLTAVIVGGTSLTGGVGGIQNTLIGVLLITVIHNGMIQLGFPSFIQEGIMGLLILFAVALSFDRSSLQTIK